jgi:Family of unknown function (DUF6152)
MKRNAALWAVLTVFGWMQPAGAHHSGAMFEPVKSLEFEGTVKEFQWTNPHSWLQVLKPNDQGVQEEWSLELGPLVGLARAGWKPRTLQPGDKVKVSFHPMRDGSRGGRLISVTLRDGRVFNGQAGAPPDPPAGH